MLRSLASFALIASLATGVAHADSFKTEPEGGSKVASRVGPPAYKGQDFTRAQAKTIVQKGTTLMKSTKNAAVRMDAIRIVDSATMEQPGARRLFARNLAQLSKQGAPADRFARGYNLLMRTGGKGALAMVQKAARQLPNDSAIQLGAFQATADYAFGTQVAEADRGALLAKAAGYYKAAAALSAKEDRPLVRENLKETTAYAQLYPALAALLK